jgi:hypothetical protein
MRARWSSLPAACKRSWAGGAVAVLVAVYGLLGLAWEPLLMADAHYRMRYPCEDTAPWAWVISVAVLGAGALLIGAVVQLLRKQPKRTAGGLLLAVVALLVAVFVVGGIAGRYGADDDCPARPLAAGVQLPAI